MLKMRRDKEDQGGDYVVERPIHSNPDEPLFGWFLWLGIRVLSAPGASKSSYICGDENEGLHTVRYDSKVETTFFVLSLSVLFLMCEPLIILIAFGRRTTHIRVV